MPPSPEEILDALDPEQRAVAQNLTGPMCVLAGAGTGKTRAITHRIAYGVRTGLYRPQQVLAVTFTARAAGEMRTRLSQLGADGVQARTFHAAALRQLQYFWPRVVGGSVPALLEHKARLVGRAAAVQQLSVDRATVRDLSAEIEWSKVNMLTAEQYPVEMARRKRRGPAGLPPRAVAAVIGAYERIKQAESAIDFEDILLLLVGILQEAPEVAAAVHEQYRHFVVDEYQDVSPVQQRLLDEWVGRRDDVCVVGDASQTIYSFAGASPDYLLRFPRRYPGAQVVELVRDYRSTPQIVQLANSILAGRPGRVELVSQCASGPQPRLSEYADDAEEAHEVARAIRAAVDAGTPPSQIAVLYRTNGQSEPFEQALTEANVPFVLRGGERFFARPEVRQAMVLLRGSVSSADPGAPLGELVRDILASVGWSEQAPQTTGAVRDRWESLQAIVTLADDLCRPAAGEREPVDEREPADEREPGTEGEADLGTLVAELERRATIQYAPTGAGVTLSTLHAAKGLEWGMVAMVGLSEGLLPISYADTPQAVEEERRLFYVGVTRAKSQLLLSFAAARAAGGRSVRSRSRFLTGIGEPVRRRARGPAAAKSGKGTLHRRCRSCGADLNTAAARKTGRCRDCPPPYDAALFEELRSWRKRTAEEAGMPAFVVFTDSTLELIAEHRPGDVAGLSRISGVGPAKLNRYGDGILTVIRQWEAAHC